MPERSLGGLITNKSWEVLQQRFELAYSAESEANLQEFNQKLLEGSGVIYANHTSFKDVPVAVSLVRSRLTNARTIIGPAGMKHYDFSRDRLAATGIRLLGLLNIHALPVVQVDDNVDYGKDRIKMLKDLKRRTDELMTKPGSVYGIAPEGTRNKIDGTLQRANRGMGYLSEYEDLYYLPMALLYKEFTDTPGVVIGEPLQLPDIIPDQIELSDVRRERAQQIADIHMIRLSELMPPEMRGVYAGPE